jgi:hypothetical protein
MRRLRLKTMRVGGVLLVVIVALAGCESNAPSSATAKIDQVAKHGEDPALQCASRVALDTMRDAIFDDAIAKVEKKESVKLNSLRAAIAGRMENPVVTTHDATLRRTECAGRIVFGLPPNTQKAFGDADQLSADVTFSVQPAADGSGLVVTSSGTETIVESLVQGANHKRMIAARAPSMPRLDDFPPPRLPDTRLPDSGMSDLRLPEPRLAEFGDSGSERSPNSGPSYRCTGKLSSVERQICDDPGLAAQDQTMAETWSRVKGRATGERRADLDMLRQRYLGRRNRCGDAGCIARVYDDWISALNDWDA